jgi:hypothetical protein
VLAWWLISDDVLADAGEAAPAAPDDAPTRDVVPASAVVPAAGVALASDHPYYCAVEGPPLRTEPGTC